jgi:hypothetical protein
MVSVCVFSRSASEAVVVASKALTVAVFAWNSVNFVDDVASVVRFAAANASPTAVSNPAAIGASAETTPLL